MALMVLVKQDFSKLERLKHKDRKAEALTGQLQDRSAPWLSRD
jgi:hypothetical protein